MATGQQNGRLNKDLDGILTSSYFDENNNEWYMIIRVKDGAIESIGSKEDTEATDNGSVIAILKRLRTLLGAGLPNTTTLNGNLKVAVAEPIPAGENVIGSVIVTACPLPTGAATSDLQTAIQQIITSIKDTDGIKKIQETITTKRVLSGSQIGSDIQLVWENGSAANVIREVVVSKPDIVTDKYQLIVYNPSTVTDLIVDVCALETLGGEERNSLLTRITVPRAQTAPNGITYDTHTFTIEGLFNGTACKFIAYNTTELGASDAFSAYLRIREL